jgi:hypothetical protein
VSPYTTENSFQQFISQISDQHHAMTGAVIAASAAEAAALGEACLQISLDNQVDKLNWHDVAARIEQMAHIKNTLVEWCNLETSAAAAYIALRGTGDEISSQRSLLDGAAEIGNLAVQAATILQDFRPLVFEQVQDDLEISVHLLAGIARAGMLLLDSNLRLWPDEALLREYEPIRAALETQLFQLTPVSRIRNDG